MSELDDFVRRHPHGTDLQPPVPELPKPKMQSYIPAYHAQAILIETIVDLAKAEGCTPRQIQKLRDAFYVPREPALVSLDAIYGEEQ